MGDPTGNSDAVAAVLLAPETVSRFESRVIAGVTKARRTGGPVLVAVTELLARRIDPAAVVMGGRTGVEAWGVLDQPENNRSSVATLGCAHLIEAGGYDRFGSAAAEWRELVSGAEADDPEGDAGVGPIAFGGFAFADEVPAAGPWGMFGPGSLSVPVLSFVRRGEAIHLTVQAVVSADDLEQEVVESALGLIERLDLTATLDGREGPLPGVGTRISSALSPAHYVGAVGTVLDAIAEGWVSKAVLAREVLVEREQEHDPEAVMAVLREVFPSCFLYAVGRGSSTFIGASPELLIRREGLRAATVALAGSAPRSADPAVDDHIAERLLRSEKDRAEQRIVTERISEALDPVSVWVTAPDEPAMAKVANIQHLASPIRAQLRSSVSAVDLVGRLHPTPAVGGEPWSEAKDLIARCEGLDRGWYAGPIGWTDASEDGEFCVALRGALLRGREARCYAGVGVVEGSVPEDELAETELKLQAILPIVSA
ncbi:MAG: isochorismate synthase [Solirubrobacterales bacterium]|nr:isochorismate synthase [Solirubrobacterales bacterium]